MGQGKSAREPDFTRIGDFFFGGTFDPPHRGHYRIVSHILRENARARVIVMPAAASPLRGDKRLFSYRERFHFLRRLFSREIAAGRVILSRLEKTLPQPNYTVNTLAALSSLCAVKPVLVIGADQAKNLSRWHRAAELTKAYRLLIFARRGAAVVPLAHLDAEVVADFDENISATELRDRLILLKPDARMAEMRRLLSEPD